MQLDSIRVSNTRGGAIEFPLNDTHSHFYVKSVNGLGPVKAVIASSESANVDGAVYHGSTRDVREIEISLGLEPDWDGETANTLRNQLYRLTMTKSPVTLDFTYYDRFTNDLSKQYMTYRIDGVTEDEDPDIFTLQPDISMKFRCFDPAFRSLDDTITEYETAELPPETAIAYDGTVETGTEFTLTVWREVSEFTIYNRTPYDILRTLTIAHPLVDGDEVVINSNPGKKGIRLNKADNSSSSILWAAPSPIQWIILEPGENWLSVQTDGAPMPWALKHQNKYGGL